jgi:hypothetical protein
MALPFIKYLQATSESRRSAQDKLVDAILPTVVVADQNHTHSIILPRATRTIESVAIQTFPNVNLQLGHSVGPRSGLRFLNGFSNWLRNMVGTRRLELLTSTVSR